MAELYHKYRDQGFTVLAVNIKDEDRKTVERFVRKRKLPYPVLLNGGELRRDWGVSGIPANFIIDREGKLREQSVGFDKHSAERFDRIVARLLKAERAP